MERKRLTYTIEEATILLERYCVYQDRCHAEVEQKLREMHIIQEGQEKIILHLLENNFLNEERFAKSFVRGKYGQKAWGRVKIKAALKLKGISERNIASGFKEIDEDVYLYNLKNLANKKYNLITESNSYQKRQKLYLFLAQKGYEQDMINDVINPYFLD
ncbi:regulatory protein RecX [Namhaeicola litoreus]|uniref:Regulatory protein RecX n=1 Tax=Namhaeicola litoreus TaxID=1052145 RepID=A0ABW3XZH6_9FLAO